MHRRFAPLFTIIVLLGGYFSIHPAHAQSGGQVAILSINSESFPALSLQFEAFDEQKQFIRDLQPEQVRVLENGQSRALRSLELLQPGVQFTVVYNLGPELSNHFAGISRFDALQTALLDWTRRQPVVTADQFSLAANTGMQLIRSSDPGEWAATLENYQPDLLVEIPNMNSVTRAVDLATDPNPESQRKQVILLITPMFFGINPDALANLTERAIAQGVTIHVWLAASESAPSSSPEIVQALEGLAGQTGGQFFLFSSGQGLPDIDSYLDPLRYVYQATFDSQAGATATYDLQLEVDREGGALLSAAKPLFLNVEPPNPIFLSPPTQIERAWVKVEGENDSQLQPATLALRIVVEFPDGHTRPLRASRLYVDGSLAVENTSEPLDELVWDLSPYTSDGRHLLRVEVEDTLGLSKSSIERPVELIVEPARSQPLRDALNGKRLLTFAAILAAGLVLTLALVLTGRQSKGHLKLGRKTDSDPLTQPVPARIEPPSQPRTSKTRPVPERSTVARPAAAELASAQAWLVRVPDNGAVSPESKPSISPSSKPASAIPLTRRETTIGSDAQRALYRVESPTVSGLHARITLTPEGEYRISDTGSVAGTWVNYAPVPSQGRFLKHGDLVQIGKISFRFQLANPPAEEQPRVVKPEDSA